MKTEEDEAFEAIERRQGGFQAKRQMAADKLQEPVLDLDGHVVREPRKRVPKPKAQPAQEPVAWEQFYPDIGKPQIALNAEVVGYVAPQRQWVGLTDKEIAQGNKESWVTKQAWESAVWWASEKLKERNHGT